VVMNWMEMADDTDRWYVRLWTGSSWLRIRTMGMCGYGMNRVSSGYGQVGCAFMDWIEVAQDTDRWDVRLWTGYSWMSLRTDRMCGYGLDRAG